MRRRDGSIQSANLPSKMNLKKNQVAIDNGVYRCMITEVFFIDDENNYTFDNQQVTYEAIILGGRKEGQLVTNIKSANFLGGQYNYHERIYRKSIDPFNGPSKVGLPEQRGDIVYVAFINGDTSLPIIIGCGTSPLDKDTTGASTEDGPIWRMEYNGVFQKISKEGEYEFTRKGGAYNADGQYFVPADRATEEENGEEAEELFQHKLELKDNSAKFSDPKNEIELLKEEAKLSLRLNKEGAPQSCELDGGTDKITITMANGMTLVLDGGSDKATITTAGGAKIDVDGNSDTAIVQTSGGATFKASEDKVAIGSSEELLQILSELCDTLFQDTYNLGYPSALSAQYQLLQQRIDSIKGTL